MDKKIKKRWVAALRSGKYKQGRGHLRKGKDRRSATYCCLGVLCDIATDKPWRKRNRDPEDLLWRNLGNRGNCYTLSDSFKDKAGLSTVEVGKLIDMNDDGERSFKEIADHIEKNL